MPYAMPALPPHAAPPATACGASPPSLPPHTTGSLPGPRYSDHGRDETELIGQRVGDEEEVEAKEEHAERLREDEAREGGGNVHEGERANQDEGEREQIL